MNKKGNFILHLLFVLFTISVWAAVIPCGSINIYGLFGEVESTIVINKNHADTEEIKSTHKDRTTSKGINVYNVYFELVIAVTCIIYSFYAMQLPNSDTIVTLKIRMDN